MFTNKKLGPKPHHSLLWVFHDHALYGLDGEGILVFFCPRVVSYINLDVSSSCLSATEGILGLEDLKL